MKFSIIKKVYRANFFRAFFLNFRQAGFVIFVAKKVCQLASRGNMRFPVKLAVGSACAGVFIVLFGFVMFPKMIKGKIKAMVNLKPGAEIRDMFLKVPFPLAFNIYIFSVTNPDEVNQGGIPKLKEMGPFCYDEWKTKINVEDVEGDDTISYEPVDTFLKAERPGCLARETEVTIPHPMILGMVNAVARQKPGALTLANKAIKSIWSNPTSLFVKVRATDLLFDGVIINCGVTDFAGKAICTNLKAEPSLVPVENDGLAFSLFGPKNATPGKRIRAFRGTQDYHNVGRIITYDGKPRMEVWNDSRCDAILGTDGTIFPPLLPKGAGLASFAPDLCRSLIALYNTTDKYDGIKVGSYYATLGDQSKNPDEKCFCTTPETCLKKGVMDLYKCAKIPLYASLPHFYDSHESYQRGVKGLNPDVEKHGIKILFESTSGSPIWARKRLQFSMPLDPNPKVELFHNFTPTVFPIFWVEESVSLNRTFTKPLKDLFLIKRIVKVITYVILVVSLGGLGAAGYLFFNPEMVPSKLAVQKVNPDTAKSDVSSVLNGHQLEGKNNNGYVDSKY